MYIKRVTAVLCAAAMLALTACTEDTNADIPTKDNLTTTTTQTTTTAAITSDTTTTTETTTQTSEATTTLQPTTQAQPTTKAKTTTKTQTTTAAEPQAPTGVYTAEDLINLANSVYYKDFDSAADIVAKCLNVKLESYTDESYESCEGRIYRQKENKLTIMGVDMSNLDMEGFKAKDHRSDCGLISFHQNPSASKEGGITASQAKNAYNSFYYMFGGAYGEPTSTIETAEADGDKSDYSKYYWVIWDIPSVGSVWLCWGTDLWESPGYNDCIISVSHPDREKQ